MAPDARDRHGTAALGRSGCLACHLLEKFRSAVIGPPETEPRASMRAVDEEDEVADALRRSCCMPGDYMIARLPLPSDRLAVRPRVVEHDHVDVADAACTGRDARLGYLTEWTGTSRRVMGGADADGR